MKINLIALILCVCSMQYCMEHTKPSSYLEELKLAEPTSYLHKLPPDIRRYTEKFAEPILFENLIAENSFEQSMNNIKEFLKKTNKENDWQANQALVLLLQKKFPKKLNNYGGRADSHYIMKLLNTTGSSLLEKKYWASLNAIQKGNLDSLHQLLTEGVNPNLTLDKSMGYPGSMLYNAIDGAKSNVLDIVEELLKKGATPNRPDDELFYYSAEKYKDDRLIPLLKLLLKYNANPNVQSFYGDTALIKVAKDGREDVAQLLLEAGADPNIKNRRNETALYEAKKNQHTDIVNLLKKYGAQEIAPAKIVPQYRYYEEYD